ncbi:hypothetical protein METBISCDRAFT_29144 [Metschnikowia bicuspidata]|uniref:Chromosome segregation in meiosis protein 3 domain-containing protein n=1 Tax=Metschnikowia bicuspidata TaxID=27322 RepID=A0A4P9Z706_9ASCO|nr:hypothetical protein METBISCDRAFT_29144 [Metschnikowia bicuspidata]
MDSEDALGLDQPIKLVRASRVPKLTDELLFSATRGLPQICNNYHKLCALLRRLDKKFEQKTRSKGTSRLERLAYETEKLHKVLLFYQLWCHGLFPRATFSDCVQMLRGHKSFALKEYRRGLLDHEIHRLKVAKGLVAERSELEEELYQAPGDGAGKERGKGASGEGAGGVGEAMSSSGPAPVDRDESEDDWGFLSVNRWGNQLFVGDEDEAEPVLGGTRVNNDTSNIINNFNENKADNTAPDEDELLDLLPNSFMPLRDLHTQPAEPNPDDFEFSDHETELEVMREMGM